MERGKKNPTKPGTTLLWDRESGNGTAREPKTGGTTFCCCFYFFSSFLTKKKQKWPKRSYGRPIECKVRRKTQLREPQRLEGIDQHLPHVEQSTDSADSNALNQRQNPVPWGSNKNRFPPCFFQFLWPFFSALTSLNSGKLEIYFYIRVSSIFEIWSGFIEFNWVLLGFPEFGGVNKGFSGFSPGFTEFCWVLLGFTCLFRVLLGFLEFGEVDIGFTGFEQGFT